MITLFSNDCAICKAVKGRLDKERIPYEYVGLSYKLAARLHEKGGHRSAPVMTDGDTWWSGYDCVVALDSDEVCTNNEYDWRERLEYSNTEVEG